MRRFAAQASMLARAARVTGFSFVLLGVLTRPSVGADPPVIIEDDTPIDRPVLALDTGGHTNAVYKLLTTTYGDQLISVSMDKTIRFWDLATGEPTRVLRPPIARGAFGVLFSAAISPDGRLLAVGGYRARTPLFDHRIHLIALPEGQIVHSLKGHVYAIYDLAFSHDGRQLASASHDATVRLWDTTTGEGTRVLQGHSGIVHGVAWSADDQHLVSGGFDKTARIWNAGTGAAEAVMREHQGPINTVAWSPDGRTIATGSEDQSVRLYEPSGKLRYAWSKLPNQVMSVAFSPDSLRLLYTFGSNTDPPIGAAILSLKDGREVTRYTGHENSAICGIFLPDGKQAVTGDSISNIRIWDMATGKTQRRLDSQGQPVISAGWSPDGQAIAWGRSTKDATTNFGGHLERTFCLNRLDFGPPPDKSFVRAKERLGPLKMGHLIENGKPNLRTVGFEQGGNIVKTFTLPQPYDQVHSYSLLAGNRAAIGTNDGAYVVSCLTGLIERELLDRCEIVWGMAPSPDYRYLLTAGNDQIVKVWSLISGELLVSLFVAGDEWIAWTPQGYYAASLVGETLMGWHINTTPTSMAVFYSSSQFHKSLYRPDVIRRVLTAGNVYRALELADTERSVRSQKLAVTDVLPPRVSITAPAAPQLELTEPSLTVHAKAEPVDKDPVTAMRLIVDGRPYGPPQVISASPDAEPAATDEPAADHPSADVQNIERQWTVALPPGLHRLQVKAETADSYGLSQPLKVTQSAAPAADAEADNETPPVAPAGDLYVLAIGAAPAAAGQPASAAARDARSLAAALAAAGKSQFGNITTRVLSDREVTAATIDTELEKMRSQMTLADTSVVYIAAQDTLDAGHHYVFTSGGAGDQSHEVSATKLQSHLAAIPGRLMLMLDVTHSAQHTQREATGGYCGSQEKQVGSAEIDAAASEWLRELLTEDYGVVVVSANRRAAAASTAAASTAAASTAAAGTTSALVQATTEAVSGRADADGDGIVSLGELGPYLQTRIRALTDNKQTPTIERPRGVRSFPLAGPGTPAPGANAPGAKVPDKSP